MSFIESFMSSLNAAQSWFASLPWYAQLILGGAVILFIIDMLIRIWRAIFYANNTNN